MCAINDFSKNYILFILKPKLLEYQKISSTKKLCHQNVKKKMENINFIEFFR
jgi:hypothetical protein